MMFLSDNKIGCKNTIYLYNKQKKNFFFNKNKLIRKIKKGELILKAIAKWQKKSYLRIVSALRAYFLIR